MHEGKKKVKTQNIGIFNVKRKDGIVDEVPTGMICFQTPRGAANIENMATASCDMPLFLRHVRSFYMPS